LKKLSLNALCQPNTVFCLEELVALLVHLQSRDSEDDGFAVALSDADGGVVIC
jgi:hypothetical protein